MAPTNAANRALRRPLLPALWGLAALLIAACGSYAPSQGDLHAYLEARELYLKGDAEAAVPRLEALVSRARRFHQARFLLGKALFLSNRHPEAVRSFDSLLQRYPRYADASLWRARALLAAGSLAEAEEALTEALAFSSEDPRFLHAAGSLWESRGDYQKALEYYQRAAVSSNELAETYLAIGKIYSRFRVYDKSLEYIDRSLGLLDEASLLRRPVMELKKRVQKEMMQ
jgi:tetratricopeptide (TPR) repeat protein